MGLIERPIGQLAQQIAPSAWLNDPDVAAALELIDETDLVDVVEIRSLFEGDEKWLDDLAIQLAIRHLRPTLAPTQPPAGPPEPVGDGEPSEPPLDPAPTGDIDMSAWGELGVVDLSIARHLSDTLGLIRARSLGRYGLTPNELQSVSDEMPTYKYLERYLKAGHQFAALHAFVVEEIPLADAVMWTSCGIRTPARAREWLDAGFSTREATDWIVDGFSTPQRATRWRTLDLTATKARQWADAGATSPTSVIAWQRVGCSSPRSVTSWHDAGLTTPRSAEPWHAQGIPASAARRWIQVRASATSAAAAIADGITIETAEAWCARTRQDADQLRRWAKVTASPDDALQWYLTGIRSPDELRPLRKGAAVADYIWLRGKKFTKEEALELLSGDHGVVEIRQLLDPLTESDLRRLRDVRRDPSTWLRWLQLCHSVGIVSQWTAAGITLRSLEVAARDHKLKPWTLNEWIKHGFTPEQMMGAHRHGYQSPQAWKRSIEPSPPARKKVEVAPDEYSKWLTAGRHWFAAAEVEPEMFEPMLRIVHEEGLGWAPLKEDLFHVRVDEEWLDEVMDRASYLSEDLAKEPRWPRVFESEEITIVLACEGNWALAWVGVEGRGGLVCFDVVDFDYYTSERNPSWRYTAGAAIAWFLDCCLVLRGTRSDKPFGPRRSTGQKKGFTRAAGTYVPLKSFTQHYFQVVHGYRASPRPHWVAGHIRRLPHGWKPTDAARERAPAWARRQIRANPRNTWVTGFHKGSDEEYRKLRLYLSKYSALADAMALADRVDDE